MIALPQWWQRFVQGRGEFACFGRCPIFWQLFHTLMPSGDLVLLPLPRPLRPINLRKCTAQELLDMGFDPEEIEELLL